LIFSVAIRTYATTKTPRARKASICPCYFIQVRNKFNIL